MQLGPQCHTPPALGAAIPWDKTGTHQFCPRMFDTPETRADGGMGPTEGSSLLPYVTQKEHQETMWVSQEKGCVNVHTPAVGFVILLLTANILLFSKICSFLFKAWILLRMLKKKNAFSSPCIVHVRKKIVSGAASPAKSKNQHSKRGSHPALEREEPESTSVQ